MCAIFVFGLSKIWSAHSMNETRCLFSEIHATQLSYHLQNVNNITRDCYEWMIDTEFSAGYVQTRIHTRSHRFRDTNKNILEFNIRVYRLAGNGKTIAIITWMNLWWAWAWLIRLLFGVDAFQPSTNICHFSVATFLCGCKTTKNNNQILDCTL